jgi:DNA-binding MarR family transcriptional regulator
MTARKSQRQPDRADVETADKLHSSAIHLLRRLRADDRDSGLSGPRLSALSVVVYAGPLSIGDLAASEQVRPPTMTRLVKELELQGLVEKATDPNDKRVRCIKATARGKRLLEQGRTRRVKRLSERLATLPATKRRLLMHAAELIEQLARPGSSNDES